MRFLSLLNIFLILLLPFRVYSKSPQNMGAGLRGGVSFSFGSHVRQIGITVSGYCYHDFIQINALSQLGWHSRNLGPQGKGKEALLSLGAVAGFDPSGNIENFFHSGVSNQMGKKYSIGFAQNFYWDSHQTSQHTGTIGLQFGHFEITHENDILSKEGSDRYRTGAFSVAYFNNTDRFAVVTTTWTGNTNSRKSVKHKEGVGRFGYIDISETEYGAFSHGILSAQWNHYWGYGQTSTAALGIDSEHIRNAMQNQLMHDMYLFPKKWNKARNKHIPMIDSEGMPYIYADDQKIKKDKFYYQFFLNKPGYY